MGITTGINKLFRLLVHASPALSDKGFPLSYVHVQKSHKQYRLHALPQSRETGTIHFWSGLFFGAYGIDTALKTEEQGTNKFLSTKLFQ